MTGMSGPWLYSGRDQASKSEAIPSQKKADAADNCQDNPQPAVSQRRSAGHLAFSIFRAVHCHHNLVFPIPP